MLVNICARRCAISDLSFPRCIRVLALQLFSGLPCRKAVFSTLNHYL